MTGLTIRRCWSGICGRLLWLLRNPQPVVAGMRPEHDPAVPPVRRAGRALPRPAGALLTPRLLVAARDLAPGLGVARPLPLVGEVGDHGPVQRVLVHRAVEQRRGQAHGLLFRAGGGIVRRLNHGGSGLPAWERSGARSSAPGPRRAGTAASARRPLSRRGAPAR